MPTKTLIKIDRSSIRRNPDAGKTEGAKYGPFEATVYTPCATYHSLGQLTFTEEILPNPGGHMTVSGMFVVTEMRLRHGESPSDLVGQQVEKHFIRGPGCQIELHRDVVHWKLRNPPPAWLYEYELTPVMCRECGATFFHTKLKSDEIGDDWVDRICPKCGEPDCCDIEYEKIEDVVQELR